MHMSKLAVSLLIISLTLAVPAAAGTPTPQEYVDWAGRELAQGSKQGASVELRDRVFKTCLSMIEKAVAGDPDAIHFEYKGMKASQIRARCKSGLTKAQADTVDKVYETVIVKMAARYPEAERLYKIAMASRKKRAESSAADLEFARRELSGFNSLAAYIENYPALADRPCGDMTCAEMAKRVARMAEEVRVADEKRTNESREGQWDFQENFIARMKGGKRAVAKQHDGMPSACNGEAPSEDKAGIILCARASTWVYDITSTNPDGGDDINCVYTYKFSGNRKKSGKKRCQ
jgi:hypothetical protein